MSNSSEIEEQSIADLYTLYLRKNQIEKQLIELNGELKSINKKLNLGQGQTNSSEKIKLFKETVGLYKFVENRKDGVLIKDAINQYLEKNTPKGMSKLKYKKENFFKLEQRLKRFKSNFLKD